MPEKSLTKVSQDDIGKLEKKDLNVGDFKIVYKPRKKDDVEATSELTWRQSVKLRFKDFPELKKEPLGDKVMLVISGPAVRMDENGIDIGVDQIALVHGMKSSKEGKMSRGGEGKEKLKKVFGGY